MQEVGVLNRELLRTEKELEALAQESQGVEEDLARRLEEGLSGVTLLSVEGYLETLARKQVERQAHLEMVKNHLEVKRRELTGCALERKAMESLRDRQKEAFYQEMDAAQRKMDDETALVHRAASEKGV